MGPLVVGLLTNSDVPPGAAYWVRMDPRRKRRIRLVTALSAALLLAGALLGGALGAVIGSVAGLTGPDKSPA